MNINKKMLRIWLLALSIFLLTGCGNTPQPAQPEPVEDLTMQSTYIEPMPDSLDQSLIVSVDEEESVIRFYNLTLARTYTLTYNAATSMKSKFGEELVPGQLMPGDMVEVCFFREKKQLSSLQMLSDITVDQSITDFEINSTAKTMNYGGEQYKIEKTAMVLSKGNLLELNELSKSDTLKVVSKDHKILGITVEKGHGYVRLSGHDSFVDGFVEVGQTNIKRVEKEMLMVVPEGEYTFFISKNGLSGTEEISVKAGEETLVDVSKFEITDEKKVGTIIFTITPSKAELYIDGEKKEYDEPVEMTCGIHQIKVKADGYKTLTQYIKVGQSAANLNIELEEKDGKDDKDDDSYDNSPSVSGNAISVSDGDGYRVYIDAPADTELYVDGSYVGIVPTSFVKKEGPVVVSIRKEGYKNRSYTLQIDGDDKDIHYSFSNLAPKQEEAQNDASKQSADKKEAPKVEADKKGIPKRDTADTEKTD